ncbi:phosphotransferase [Sporosarcina sp. CAU 1771]
MRNVVEIMKEILGVPESEITEIKPFGGMTNINYCTSVGNDRYIVRIPGLGTDQFINRHEEKRNLEIGMELGINPEHIYFDAETGLKITRMIPGARTLTQKATKEQGTITKVTEVLRKLHDSNVKMDNDFNLYKLMTHYENNAAEANATFYSNFDEVKKEVEQIKSAYDTMPKLVYPCHIDSIYENFVTDENENLFLIDWEYSGMFDPLWDVTTHMMESGFTAQEEAVFLCAYFQREATGEEKERVLIHKIFQDYLWSIWTLFKEAKGDHFGSYGQDRFDRLQRHVKLYKEEYSNRISI